MTGENPTIEAFETSLADALTWASIQAWPLSGSPDIDKVDPVLRSYRLLPPMFTSDPTLVVDCVVSSRQDAVKSANRQRARRDVRLLYYEPSANLWDGAACAASKGYFDLEDAPPWDTWLCFVDAKFVVAWVPENYVDRVDSGIGVTIADCLGWAERRDGEFTRMLRRAGYLEGR